MAGTGLIRHQLRGRTAGATNTASTIWSLSTGNYAQLLTGTALEVVSSSANDTAAGTGARTVRVEGVDSSYAPFAETVTLNGTTPVALANTSVIGINKVKVLTAGSGLINAGTIDVRTVSGSTIKARINTSATGGLGRGQSSDFLFTIPADYTGVLKSVEFSGTAVTGDLTVNIRSYNSSGVSFDEGAGKSSLYVTAFNGGRGVVNFGEGLVIPEKTLIEGRTVVSAGTTEVIAMAELFLFKTSNWAWPYRQA